MTGLQVLEAMRDGAIAEPGVIRTLGGGIESLEEGRVRFWMEPDDRHTNPMGTTHGGVLSTFLDSAMGCAVFSALPAGRAYTTLELKVNFVRAVPPHSGRLSAVGEVLHLGGRVATAEGRVTDADGRLVAHATTTCLLMDA